MECPHLAQSVRLGANDVETTCTKDLPFVCAGQVVVVVLSSSGVTTMNAKRNVVLSSSGRPFYGCQEGYVGRDSGKNHRDGGDGDCDGNGNMVVQ
ncbi:hypothetical protein HZH66_014404 [Vespula vulgaris]|uniref:Uncharacterized protein n=1 Tax=Vespula vulgaris TaxID=7454 RepID=A0A834J1C7_VESVU|nr:hypothetical protein HZH66_014404 [Vespula vulgaris]